MQSRIQTMMKNKQKQYLENWDLIQSIALVKFLSIKKKTPKGLIKWLDLWALQLKISNTCWLAQSRCKFK